jgi:5-methylcytosine-specific restriction protein A
MPSEYEVRISKEQYARALGTEGVLQKRSVEVLRILHDAPNCEATAPQLAYILGYSDFPPANALVGKLGKRIAGCLNITLPPRADNSPGWWKIVATGQQGPEGFAWRLRKPLIEAMTELGFLDDEGPRLYTEMKRVINQLSEGKLRRVIVNSFERNAVARQLCLDHYQARCSVCELDFEQRYGEIGKGYIHVHHIIELSSIGREYKVDPIKDLRPVCPNCHAMLHQRKPPLSVEALRALLLTGDC